MMGLSMLAFFASLQFGKPFSLEMPLTLFSNGVDRQCYSRQFLWDLREGVLSAHTPRRSVLLATSALRNEDTGSANQNFMLGGGQQQEKDPQKEENCIERAFRALAELSLKDYKWRSDLYKSDQAERMLEQSLARMRGNDANYVRPMDASESTLGPLGRWEKSAVEWVSQVIHEEGRRAEMIVNLDGKLVRPKDSGDEMELGPLGFLEKKASDFLDSIQTAEKERVRSKILRPKDMDASMRGPLGEAELRAMSILRELQDSEKTRMAQSRLRGGEIVRPIDVPGPLGEFELAVLELFDSEEKRAKERRQGLGLVLRPKDAKLRGPLGEAESQAYEAILQLSKEEMKRLDSIKRILEEKRPMDNNRDSFLGIAETILVGIVRAPFMLLGVIARVKELMASEQLDDADKDIIQKRNRKPPRVNPSDKKNSSE
jgi:hypothetical protein